MCHDNQYIKDKILVSYREHDIIINIVIIVRYTAHDTLFL